MSDGQPSAAKRILSLDGGGVRGVVSIAFLERMEAELRRATGNPDMTLGRHFHLIGGTSVGSIIATMLALDWPMEKVSRTFLSLCPEIFSKRRWAWPLRTKFNEGALNNKIAAILGVFVGLGVWVAVTRRSGVGVGVPVSMTSAVASDFR